MTTAEGRVTSESELRELAADEAEARATAQSLAELSAPPQSPEWVQFVAGCIFVKLVVARSRERVRLTGEGSR